MPLLEDSLALMHTTPAENGSVLKVIVLSLFKFPLKTLLS